MNNLMKFRKLIFSDKDKYLELLSQLTNVNDRLEDAIFGYMLSKTNLELYGLTICEELVAIGTISWRNERAYKHPYYARLENIVVDKDFRGQGLGRTITDCLVQKAKENWRKPYKITLACSQENVGFYEACGFKENGREMRISL